MTCTAKVLREHRFALASREVERRAEEQEVRAVVDLDRDLDRGRMLFARPGATRCCSAVGSPGAVLTLSSPSYPAIIVN